MKRYSILLALISWMLVSCSNLHYLKTGDFKRPTNTSWLDISGVMVVPHSKGWLLDSSSRRVVFTCTHSNPAPGTIVGFYNNGDEILYRKIVQVIRINAQPYKKIELDLSTPTYENFFTSDISVCLIDETLPETVTSYKIAAKSTEREWYYNINKRNEFDVFTISRNSNNRVLVRKTFAIMTEQGDSGLPWFNSNNEVISHTTLAYAGYGPDYTDIAIRTAIDSAVTELEGFTK
jgi:hypothetical protein